MDSGVGLGVATPMFMRLPSSTMRSGEYVSVSDENSTAILIETNRSY